MDTALKGIAQLFRQPPRLFKASVHFVYGSCIRPKGATEDAQRRETILNIILVGFISLLVFFEILLIRSAVISGEAFRGESLITFTAIAGLFVGLLALSRRGYARASSYVLVGLFLFGSSLGAYKWGIDLPSSMFMFVFAITSATILVSNRFGVVTAVIVSVIIISLQIGNAEGVIHSTRDWIETAPDISDALKYAAFFFAFVLVSWLSNTDTERSLARARKSERELKEERDSLEIKVQKRTEEIQRLQMEKMSQMYRFVEFGRLSAGLFHDLINPLHALALNMQSIDATKKLSAENIGDIQDEIDRSIDASKRMERYISVLRKHLQTSDSKEAFSINDSVEDALALFNYKALKATVETRFEADERVVTYDNPLKLQQVVGNLISNAIDACAGEGEDRRTVDVRVLRHGNEAVITVKDKGHGIPQHLLEKIFDPFFTTKSGGKGMGIGLSSTKEIVEKHFKGTLSIQTAEGKGSTFTVTIPINEQHGSDEHIAVPTGKPE